MFLKFLTMDLDISFESLSNDVINNKIEVLFYETAIVLI